MGLWDKIKGEFIDIIEWVDPTSDTMVHRFDRHQNEIKNNAQLTVRESQVAVFVNEGQIADIFEPGMYNLNTENLPILSTLKGWKYGFNSPFKAEVYFVSTRNFTDLKWGTKNAVILNDDRFGMLEVRAFGTYAMRVSDAGKFIKEIVGTDGDFTTDEVIGQLKSIVVTRFSDAVGESRIPVEGFAGNLNELSEFAHGQIGPEFGEYGIDMSKFLVENVSMPEKVKEEIFELSRLEKIDLQKLAQLKSAKAIEKAAENDSGTAGAGMGMGMGFAMANQMGQTFSQQPAQSSSSPPPIPGAASIFVAQGGQRTGPFDVGTIDSMIADGRIKKDTLIWKEGMSDWLAAENEPSLKSKFGNVPPPIPGSD
jgi:membrane protease subunit (stomatin/prohibitin family)